MEKVNLIFKKIPLFLTLSALIILLGVGLGATSGQRCSSDLKIGVSPYGYDDMGQVLTSLGYSYKELSFADLKNYEKIKDFDLIFLNSSQEAILEGQKNSALGDFIKKGGILYASDWAYSFIEKNFPNNIKFYKTAASPFSNFGKKGIFESKIIDSELKNYLKKETLKINFDFAGWAIIDSLLNKNAKIYLTANIKTTDNKNLKNKPLLVSFKAGQGEVIFSSFNNISQEEESNKLLEYFISKCTYKCPSQQVLPSPSEKNLPKTSKILNFLGENILFVGTGFFIALVAILAIFFKKRIPKK